ncbi:hypothetical protein D1646_16560 [Pseudoflavonifractor sp. 60]|uniref:hypothetical protein n=1 Tax=Pseudoflavonifractor sp. 60 TaxID=2304576 RepID=UPI001370D21F|nr:hypothetical protein [Pseudoflavonifractor sp. 60]NBI68380.1 hypothetical protein [Pseudoflavonifractor sp. 60]
MERIRSALGKLCILPALQTVLIAVPAFLLVGYVLLNDVDGPLAYLAYAASAYGLIVALTGVFRVVRLIRQGIKEHPLGERLLEDVGFRTELSLYAGFSVNLLYIVLKMAIGHGGLFLWPSITLCWLSCGFLCSIADEKRPQ